MSSRIDRQFEKLSISFFRFAKKMSKFTIYSVIMFFIGSSVFNFGYRLFYERSIDKNNKTTIEYVLTENKTAEDIAKDLIALGIIDDELAFKFRAKIYKTKFNTGIYSLSQSMSIKNILDIFDDAKGIELEEETTSSQVLTEDQLLDQIIGDEEND